MRCGENLLSYGANSVQMLTGKLMRRGFSKENATRAAEKLQSMGLIDEAGDLRREVEKCLRKLWGAKRIRGHLWGRGFGAEAMDGLEAILSEVDFVSNCKMMIQKHYGAIPKEQGEQRKMVASLTRYGYSLGEIKEALQLLLREN
jgi:SOS response regulatory protein OraA/RecX